MKPLTRLLGPRTLQREDGVAFSIGEKVYYDTEQNLQELSSASAARTLRSPG